MKNVFQEPKIGWDVGITCACLSVLEDGVNPYYQENVAKLDDSQLSCTYHALTYYLIKPWCAIGDFYLLSILSFFLLCFLLVRRAAPDIAMFAAFFFTAFCGAVIFYFNGNIVTGLEAVFLCAAVAAISARKDSLSTGAISSFVFLKLATAPFLLAHFVFLQSRGGNVKKQVAIAVATLAGLHAVTLVVAPTFFLDHFRGIMGTLPNAHSPVAEKIAGGSNPTLTVLFQGLARSMEMPFILGMLIPVCLGSVLLVIARSALRASKAGDSAAWALLLLAVSPAVPRTKPYFFMLSAVLLYFAASSLSRRRQWLVLFTAAMFPLLHFKDHQFRDTADNAWKMIENLNQPILLIICVCLLIRFYRKPDTAEP